MFVCVVLCEPNLSRQLEGDYRSRLVAEMPEHSHIVHLFKAEKRTKKVIYLCRDIMGDERSYALSNADVRVKCLIYLACVMLIFCVTFCARQIREKTRRYQSLARCEEVLRNDGSEAVYHRYGPWP